MELDFDFATSFDLVTGKLDSIDKSLKNPDKPFYNYAIASDIIPAANAPLVLDLGSPNTGRIWNVTGITLVGVDDATTLANAKAALYFGDSQALGLFSVVVPALTIPVFQTFSDKVLWCHSTSNVTVRVTGTATIGSQVLAKVMYTDWPEEAISGNSGR